jgi:hypothetical protein
MQYLSIFALIGLLFGGLGLITDLKFFIPQRTEEIAGKALAESSLDIIILNANPTSISLGQKAELVWMVSGATSVVIDPGIGPVASAGQKTVSPDKTTTYTVVATNSTGSVIRTVTIGVNQPLSPPIITSFTASTNNITANQPVTLKWSTRNADSAVMDQGIGDVPVSGMQIVTPSATTVYTLTAKNDGGPVTAQVMVVVQVSNQPVIDCFTLTADDVTSNTCNITAGDPVYMRWNVLNAQSVSIDQGIGIVAPNGMATLHPKALTRYTLMASNQAGAVTAYATCNVTTISLPVIGAFTLTPATIKPGESASLKWSVSGEGPDPDDIQINQGVGIVSNYGQFVVSPSVTTTYTITAENGQGKSMASITLVVAPTTHPGIISFTATPPNIRAGQSATLQWSITGASTVSISPNVGTVAASGSAQVSPATTTVYTITAINSAGSITGYAMVTVSK